MNPLAIACLFLFSFFCGSIPTGYLLLKAARNQDIRTLGSGNTGSTNVRRAAGAGLALITQIADIAKGLIPVAIAIGISRHFDFGSAAAIVPPAVALAAILGHDFSPFLGFHGGKGVNTTAGVFLLIAPIPTLIAAGAYFALRLATPIVSIRSLALGLVLAVTTTVFGSAPAIIAAAWIAALLIIIRHIENIKRLARHKEQ